MSDARALDRPGRFSRRALVLATLGLLGLLAYQQLGLRLGSLLPAGGGRQIAARFFRAAIQPALDYEAAFTPEGTPPFGWHMAQAVWRTLVFAAAAMSLALPVGLLLGYLGATTSWEGDPAGSSRLRQVLAPSALVVTRLTIALMRSVHELLWAVIFLAAMGLASATAVVAIAIPFAGTLAKVFSEMLDEAPRQSAAALRSTGATPAVVFLCARLPRALPDLAAYTFYRFECAVRSSAILGFFGFPTLGYYLRASFENLHYREVWSYLYALLALSLVLEAWSSRLRKRFVA